MKIAQIAPLYESVPPQLYGGTERVVSYLTEELVEQGHEVTLFASGDSRTKARLISASPAALRLSKKTEDSLAWHFLQLQEVIDRRSEFDVLHFHNDYIHFPVTKILNYPNVTTLHGRLDIPDLYPLYRKFKQMPVISISDYQRTPLPFANWIGTVHHGLPKDRLKQGNGKGDYVAFLGRISPEKGIDHAIDIALRAGLNIKIAAKIDSADERYFNEKIARLFKQPGVEYVGEITEKDKQEFLGNAKALLFPIVWPEPFGLVMIEALAVGTPVLAFRNGSVPEVIDEGTTGYVVNTVDEAVKVIPSLLELKREKIREVFESRFTSTIMAAKYLGFYRKILGQRTDKDQRGDSKSGSDNHFSSFRSS